MFFDRYSLLCKNSCKTPTGVAVSLGVSRATVNYWKKGNTPKREILLKIADYFNVSVDYLLEKTDIKEKKESTAINIDNLDSNFIETLNRLAPDLLKSEHKNIIKIAGRDGSYEERVLTDDQLELLKKLINALPEATDL